MASVDEFGTHEVVCWRETPTDCRLLTYRVESQAELDFYKKNSVKIVSVKPCKSAPTHVPSWEVGTFNGLFSCD